MTPPAFFALFSRSKKVPFEVVKSIALSVQAQLTEDVFPVWGRKGTITAYPDEPSVPHGQWKVVIEDDIGEPGALGFHTDELNQPVAFVSSQNGNIDQVSITVSHEVVETLLDPYGNRLVANVLHPTNNKERVRMLLEACDPSEAKTYKKLGHSVSDFYTPEWLDDSKKTGVKYTFLNAISKPRQIIQGGYLTFVDSRGGFWQVTQFGTMLPSLDGPFNWTLQNGESVRGMVDRYTEQRKKE